jgi:hypothetical protein
MNRAATQDLRLVRVWPVVREVLARGTGTARAAAAAQLLDEWLAQGGSRLDRDLDGSVDAAGAAILDGAWPGLADAVLAPVLGPLTDRFAQIVPRDEPMNPGGSSYYAGWWSYVDKDLRALLGKPVRERYATRFCGRGDVAACAASLWSALDAAAAALAQSQGPDPGAWRAPAGPERIRFAPGILAETMRGTNRPTFQQLVTFDGHRPRG